MNKRHPLIIISLPISLCILALCLPSFAVAAGKHKQHKSKVASSEAGKVPIAEVSDKPRFVAAILIDAASGDVLFEQNAHTPLPPASMTKLMVAYVVLKKLEEGAIKSTDTVKVSAFASKIGGSQVYLKENEEFTVSELVEALMVQSANDAAMALAEYIGGSKEGFVDMMNQAVQELGLKESTFHSPHGLPPGKGQEPDLVSAHDFAELARTLINRYPDILKYTSTVEKDFREGAFHMRNHNDLLNSFQGCDGLKTGYYAQAGFCITATANRNTARVIAVVMGSPTKKIRAEETKRLLSMGFSNFKSSKVIASGTALPDKVPVRGGKVGEVSPVAASDLSLMLKASDVAKVLREPQLCAELVAPVAANTECGTIKFKLGDKEIGRVKAVVKDQIPKGGIVDKIKEIF